MKKLAIIGGAGQMGVLFATYFQNKNYDVVLYDINNDKAIATSKKLGVSSTNNIKKALTHSEIVIVSVPLEKTPDVISNISSLMPKGAVLIEISSLKSNVLGVMRDLSRFKVQPLSIHPLIGPGVKNLKGQNLVVIPIKDPDGEIEIAKQLFYDMSIDDMECEKHDEIMSITITLNHLICASLLSIIKDLDIEKLRNLGGPSFQLLLLLCESALSQEQELYSSIKNMNEYSDKWLNKFDVNYKKLKNISNTKTLTTELNNIQKHISTDPYFPKSYKIMYEMFSVLKNSSNRDLVP